MNRLLSLTTALAALTSASTTSGGEKIVTIGDSLTFAYEASFGFQISIPPLVSFGDGFGSGVKNWIEILSDPSMRGEQFDQGARDEITVSLIPFRSDTLFLRQVYNWAIPGAQIDDLRRFLNAEADIIEVLEGADEFDLLGTALSSSDFSVDDFAVVDLVKQLQNEASRAVVFVGGNDINALYETIYEGGSPGSFVSDFIDDMTFILDWVLAKNPSIELVLVSVPHVGITPDVKASHPPDPVKTARVTAVLDDLNTQLKSRAATRGIGFADAYIETLPLLEPDPFPVFGVPFENTGSESGDLAFSWLNGEVSYNFHPNTNVQALLANIIIDAFNDTYGPKIARLTATEILGELLGKSSGEIDMPYGSWQAAYGLPTLSTDFDDDGVSDRDEWAMGLNPTQRDAHRITSGRTTSGAAGVEIVYPVRLPGSSRITITPETAPTLDGTFTTVTPQAEVLPDGRYRAAIPIDDRSGFLKLSVRAVGAE